MKKQVCSSLLALSMTASILSPAALAADLTVPDDNQNAIAVVSENDAAGNNDAVADQTNSEQNESEEVTVNTEEQSVDSDKESEEDVKTPNAESDFTTKAVDGGVEITGYTGETKDVVIPATIGGEPVVSIGAKAFEAEIVGAQKVAPGLTSVTIPKSVTSIGELAFGYNEELSSITLPNSLETIGKQAFRWCSALKEVTIPSSVKTLGEEAFASCGLQTVTIEEGLQAIPKNAFIGCEDLNTITIPKSVKTIGESAFGTVAYYGAAEGEGDEDAVLSLVNYGGTKAEWDALQISIGEYNDPFEGYYH